MEPLPAVLRKVWGYDSFRPLQAEAMQAVLDGRDSVVVMPTGGGKSLCYQAPALCLPGLGVVVSPLISLMKDQVDALLESGVPAACIHSGMTPAERREVAAAIDAGRLKLLYLSPERLLTERTLEYLHRIEPSFFAIDEAHCISDWGHDFRPEYRGLRILKQQFPQIGIHAYTATATARVRDDIARELGLVDPQRLVGDFDRPNLVYRVYRRTDRLKQISEIVDRHPEESGIIYCIRRRDVEDVAEALGRSGRTALPYHAGLSDETRRDHQDAFIKDRVKIIVATVAFGMGIDKSNVRFVIHAAAPKSLESYQQESGRAGRDGLEAECCLLHSPADIPAWKRLQKDLPPRALEAALQLLDGIERYATGTTCRHAALVGYFDQGFETENCHACDVCLEELEYEADSLLIAQKILSCVLRLQENYGGQYVAQVLAGSKEQRILDQGHDRLSTYGLLSEHRAATIRDWLEQLVAQGHLQRYGDYKQLRVAPSGRGLLRGTGTPRLLKHRAKPVKVSKSAADSWAGVERGLFDHLRGLRRTLADQRGLPPFVVFGDATLRDLARRRPDSPQTMLEVHGVGEQKLARYGETFLRAIDEYCREHGLDLNAASAGERM